MLRNDSLGQIFEKSPPPLPEQFQSRRIAQGLLDSHGHFRLYLRIDGDVGLLLEGKRPIRTPFRLGHQVAVVLKNLSNYVV
jgi:hypothetical protein